MEPETNEEVTLNDFVEKYIAELQWDKSTPDDVKTVVAGNIRGFWSRVKASNVELRKRYNESRALLKRCCDAYYREAYNKGETIQSAMSEALDWVSHEELEEEFFDTEHKKG